MRLPRRGDQGGMTADGLHHWIQLNLYFQSQQIMRIYFNIDVNHILLQVYSNMYWLQKISVCDWLLDSMAQSRSHVVLCQHQLTCTGRVNRSRPVATEWHDNMLCDWVGGRRVQPARHRSPIVRHDVCAALMLRDHKAATGVFWRVCSPRLAATAAKASAAGSPTWRSPATSVVWSPPLVPAAD